MCLRRSDGSLSCLLPGSTQRLSISQIVQHHRRISPEPRQPRPFHRGFPERRAELFLIEQEYVRRQRHRVLAGDELPRPER